MISLKQFTGSQVVAKDDAILYEWLSQNAVSLFFGCEVTSLGANMMRITSGRGIILGRTFEVQQEDFTAQLATPGSSWKGRVYVEIDTANAAQPISIKTVAAESLAPLVQEDINGDGTIYQFELYTYDASSTDISNLVRTAKTSEILLPKLQTLTVSLNGANQGQYNGETEQDINLVVTPQSIGALPKIKYVRYQFQAKQVKAQNDTQFEATQAAMGIPDNGRVVSILVESTGWTGLVPQQWSVNIGTKTVYVMLYNTTQTARTVGPTILVYYYEE